MYDLLFLALLVGAGALTFQFGVRDNGSFFASLIAFALWGYLAFQTEIQTAAADGAVVVFEIPASLRFLFAGLAIVAAFELLWQIFGHDDSMTTTDDTFAMER